MKENHNRERYIGDGVYVQTIGNGYGFWLKANSHSNPTDQIFIEERVWEALKEFIDGPTTKEE